MATTANLSLPLLTQSQANKDVTLNESLQILDSKLGVVKSSNNGKLVGVSSGVGSAISVGGGLEISGSTLQIPSGGIDDDLIDLKSRTLPIDLCSLPWIDRSVEGIVTAKKTGSNYEVWTPFQVNRAREWARWVLYQSASGRRFEIDGLYYERHFSWVPTIGPDSTYSSAAIGSRYSCSSGGPAVVPELSFGEWIQVTVTGEGPLYLLCHGRSTAYALEVAISGDVEYDESLSVASVTATASEIPVYTCIHPYLPKGTYTVKLTAPTFGTYPIAVGFSGAVPHDKVNQWKRTNPTVLRWGSTGSFINPTPTSASKSCDSSVFSGGQDINGKHFYIGCYAKTPSTQVGKEFDQVEIEFSIANGGGGSLKVEYYNGSWVDLTLIKNTVGNLATNGVIKFTPPSDWVDTTVDSEVARYIRLSSTGTSSGIVVDKVFVRAYFYSPQTTLAAFTGGSVWETVWMRDENDGSSTGVGGGHGFESGAAKVFLLDGVDITSGLGSGGIYHGRALRLRQTINYTQAADGTGSTVGTGILSHDFVGSKCHFRHCLTALATTTMEKTDSPASAFGYALNCAADRSIFDRIEYAKPGRVELQNMPSTDSSILGGTDVNGTRLYSTSHGYSLAMIQPGVGRQSFNFAHAPDSGVIVVSTSSNDKIYCHISTRLSGGNTRGPVVLYNGDKWATEGIWLPMAS